MLATVRFVSATGGFTAAEMVQAVEVGDIDEESTYLGPQIEPDEENRTTTVVVANQFAHDPSEVTIESGNASDDLSR